MVTLVLWLLRLSGKATAPSRWAGLLGGHHRQPLPLF